MPCPGKDAPLHFRAEHFRDQVERLLVHRAALDGVDGAIVRARVRLQAALEHADDGRFAAADRPHQQEDPLAHLQPLAGGAEVVHHLPERVVNTE